MAIPLTYTIRSLFTRKLTVALTILGIALVVFVFAAVLMLAYGVEKTLRATGYTENVLALRKGSDNELTSGVDRDLANTLLALPHIARDAATGRPIATKEVVTIINMSKFTTNDMGNISVRGVSAEAAVMRPVVNVTRGRMFTEGSHEVIVGTNIEKRFQGAQLGQTIKISGDTWTIVGVFEADGTGFESEIWGDVELLLGSLNRLGAYSSVTMRLRDNKDFEDFKAVIESDNRLQTLKIEREQEYYERQSKFMAIFIRILGLVITIGFSAGAVIGAMITMYAAVANRTVEIGTLRALGFQRSSIMFAFLIESILLSTIGGVIGLVIASGLQFFTLSTMNFGTFVELAFSFSLSPEIAVSSLFFSLAMGIIGGFLPAARASRLDILTALRAS